MRFEMLFVTYEKIIPFCRYLWSFSTTRKFTLNIDVNNDNDEEWKALYSGWPPQTQHSFAGDGSAF